MPLFAWGRGYSWKLPIAELDVMVVCVPVETVEGGVAVVLLQETRNKLRSIREHEKDRRFITIPGYAVRQVSTCTFAKPAASPMLACLMSIILFLARTLLTISSMCHEWLALVLQLN